MFADVYIKLIVRTGMINEYHAFLRQGRENPSGAGDGGM